MSYAIPNSEESCSAQRAVAALGTKHTSSASTTFSGGHEQSMETWSKCITYRDEECMVFICLALCSSLSDPCM